MDGVTSSQSRWSHLESGLEGQSQDLSHVHPSFSRAGEGWGTGSIEEGAAKDTCDSGKQNRKSWLGVSRKVLLGTVGKDSIHRGLGTRYMRDRREGGSARASTSHTWPPRSKSLWVSS